MKKQNKEKLIIDIQTSLLRCDEFNQDIELAYSIAQHISKMPKRTRIPFIKALIIRISKSMEYDEMQSIGDPNYSNWEKVIYKNPDWNK